MSIIVTSINEDQVSAMSELCEMFTLQNRMYYTTDAYLLEIDGQLVSVYKTIKTRCSVDTETILLHDENHSLENDAIKGIEEVEEVIHQNIHELRSYYLAHAIANTNELFCVQLYLRHKNLIIEFEKPVHDFVTLKIDKLDEEVSKSVEYISNHLIEKLNEVAHLRLEDVDQGLRLLNTLFHDQEVYA